MKRSLFYQQKFRLIKNTKRETFVVDSNKKENWSVLSWKWCICNTYIKKIKLSYTKSRPSNKKSCATQNSRVGWMFFVVKIRDISGKKICPTTSHNTKSFVEREKAKIWEEKTFRPLRAQLKGPFNKSLLLHISERTFFKEQQLNQKAKNLSMSAITFFLLNSFSSWNLFFATFCLWFFYSFGTHR